MKIISTIGAAALFLTMPAAAQQSPESTAKQMQFVADCDLTEKVINNVVSNFGEKPIVDARGVVINSKGELLTGYTVITGNSNTATYSVTLNLDNGYTCIVMFGDEIAPYTQK